MALRKLRIEGDPILRKKSKRVDAISDKIKNLMVDMEETMKNSNGIGLAAPQVGILKRIIVVDVGNGLYKMINPEILEKSGSQIDVEGCLSIPDFNGTVERPQKIKVKYFDENMEERTEEAEDLFARCICHEIDHLDGILFRDKYIDEIDRSSLEDMEK